MISCESAVLVDSTTYIVVSNLATFHSQSDLVTNLLDNSRLRDQRISPHLVSEDRVRLIYQRKKNPEFVDHFDIDEAFEEIIILSCRERKQYCSANSPEDCSIKILI